MYSLIRRITDFLAHELVHPFVRLVVFAFVGGQAGDYERHVEFVKLMGCGFWKLDRGFVV
jgi:hypothetical protein